MSVIIRLQNLPWSANAADIRQFFHGLSIPEGGVHIVGGALGDAFIAFSTDEDARQGMASDGGMLKDSRVKLFLSSRTEMQKIIEETRQHHLALQAAASGVPNIPTAAVQPRQFTSGPFAPIPHVNPSMNAAPVRPMSSDNSMYHMNTLSQTHLSGYNQPPVFQQANHLFNQRMMPDLSVPGQIVGFQTQTSQQQSYAPHVQDVADHHLHNFGDKRMRPVELPAVPYREQPNYGPSSDDMRNVYQHDVTDQFNADRGRRHPRDSPPEGDRNRSELDRSGNRNRDRTRNRDRERDKDRSIDTNRRGRRSRSRSGSRGRGRERDRRRRSRSDSRERGRGSRDRDRNSKAISSKSGLLPTPAESKGDSHSLTDGAHDTSVQLRLLTGDLTYRDIRDYLNGIHVPNTCIKMINALDGYRFGLAYIQFTSKADKQKALSRNNGMIRGYPVQIFHVEDSAFHQAIDSYSPGINLDSKSLSKSCLSLRDFPPVAAAHNVREAFGTISIGQVLTERNESGTVTGLCYTELSSEADARKAIQLLKDGVMICGRPVKMAFLPIEELNTCAKNLDRLRTVVNGGPVLSSFPDGPLSPGQSTGLQRSGLAGGRLNTASFSDNSLSLNGNGVNGTYDTTVSNRARPFSSVQRVFITGLPPTALERDIGDFFSDVGVIPQTIEIVYDEHRVPVGNAFCQFANMHEAERALDKNGGFMGGHTVGVTLVENHDVPSEEAAVGHSANETNFNPYSLEGNVRQSDIGSRDYVHPSGPSPNSSYPPTMNNDGGNGFHSSGGARFGGGPRFAATRYPAGGNFRGVGGSGFGPPRSHSGGNIRMRIPGRGGGGGSRGGSRNGSDDGSPTPGFGAPGCVVALANVPTKAVIADILDFFRGFQVNEKCVIRRFGPNGEPTGDARVAFPSPDEAEAAVRTLQNEYLLNRRVMLSIV